MAHSVVPPALACLRDSNSAIQAKISALKQLKNDIIGHDQRKEEVIRQGLVPILVNGLRLSETEIQQHSDLYSEPRASGTSEALIPARNDSWTHEDEHRLQCYFVAASLARGGLPFVTPLLAGGILEPLFQSLSAESTPQKVVLEALRTIHLIVDALWSDIRLEKSKNVRNLQEGLYTEPVLRSIAGVLKQRDTTLMTIEQIGLILQIMSTSLDQPRHQDSVIEAGILDELAARLATHMTTTIDAPLSQHPEHLPPPLPDRLLPSLLDALTAVVWGSLYRSSCLLYSGEIANDSQGSQPEEHIYDNLMAVSAIASDPSDLLLPRLQAVHSKSELSSSRAFPALGTLSSSTEQGSLGAGPLVSSRIISTNDFGSPVLAWLVHLARTTDQAKRLSALWLLVSLMHMSDSSSIDGWRETGNRNRTCAFLIIPLLVRIIQESTSTDTGMSGKYPDDKFSRDVREKAPRALAMLIEDHKDLQKAAYDAGAIKLLSQILKKTFDYGTSPKKSMWTASTSIDDEMEDIADNAAMKLGSRTLPAEQVHVFRLRAAALEALAAVTQRDDQYRKLVLDQGVMQSIVDSLTPWPDGPTETKAEMGSEGNPPFVIIQACKVATSLSRSVSMLRTSLIDGGIAKPVFALLKHPSRGVRQYGTNVITNLVLHFSPMREELVQLGLMKVLCEHVRTTDVELAISSMWALKHLVNATPNSTKLESLNEIGVEFLTQILVGGMSNQNSNGSLQRTTMATANAAGEQVDILNADDTQMTPGESSVGLDDGLSEEEPMFLDYAGPVLQVQGLLGLKERRAQLKAIREVETSTVLRSQRDDVRMQEQALDFLRNLIGEPGLHQKEMIDHLFAQFGTARLFEILASKFQSKSSSSTNKTQRPRTDPTTSSSTPIPRRASPFQLSGTAPAQQHQSPSLSSSPNNPQDQMVEYIPSEVIISSLFILIHIANGRPSHRSTLIAQPNLLATILPLFNHTESRVRVACCWLIHNLTWQEDSSDTIGARQRALELRAKGVEDAVRRLTRDSDVDTRDRAKSVIDVFRRLLGEDPSGLGDVSEVGQQNLGGAVITGGARGAAAAASTPSSSARAWER